MQLSKSLGTVKKGGVKQSTIKSAVWHLRWLVSKGLYQSAAKWIGKTEN